MVGAPSQPNSVTGHRRPVKAKPLRGGWLGAYRFIVAQASTKSDLENTGSRIFSLRGLDRGTILVTLVRPLQPQNAESPMLVTLDGIE